MSNDEQLEQIAIVRQGYSEIKSTKAGRALAKLREARGWSLSDLAEMVGCHPSYISKLEHGRPMSAKIAEKIIEAFENER